MLPGVSVRQHIKKLGIRKYRYSELVLAQVCPLRSMHHCVNLFSPQTVLYPDSPGFKSDILHENYPAYRRQPFTSSHIYCNHAKSIITHLWTNCNRQRTFFSIYFVNFLCARSRFHHCIQSHYFPINSIHNFVRFCLIKGFYRLLIVFSHPLPHISVL